MKDTIMTGVVEEVTDDDGVMLRLAATSRLTDTIMSGLPMKDRSRYTRK